MNDLTLVDVMTVLDQGPLEVEVMVEVNERTVMRMVNMRGLKGGETVRRSGIEGITQWYVCNYIV